MSTITRIDYTVADGNAWTEDEGYDMDSSLDRLAEQIDAALTAAYPQATVTVTRENAGGAVRELRAESDDDDGFVDDDTQDEIKAVANGVWEAGDWYVEAA